MFLTERKSNLKDNTKTIKARKFVEDVRKLADEYNLPFFVVTDGASATSNNNCSAVKNARDCHIEWEKKNGHDPYEDWGRGNKI